MGKKRSQGQNHQTQSFGNMVSKAALAQMGPAIEKYVKAVVQNLGQQLSVQQAGTLETLFARTVVLEEILMDKFQLTKEDLATKVSEVEDRKENLEQADSIEKNDVVRLEISTKIADQTEYAGSSRLKVYETGSGGTLGNEIEDQLVGMKTGETKEFSFGKDKTMTAKVTIDRISRAKKVEVPQENNEAQNADQTSGQ
jgi:hypothetical protein